jgi:hypothetical protein
MDISAEETNQDVNQPGPISILLQVVRDTGRRLIGFFVLSKEEQAQAGIDFRGEDRRE